MGIANDYCKLIIIIIHKLDFSNEQPRWIYNRCIQSEFEKSWPASMKIYTCALNTIIGYCTRPVEQVENMNRWHFTVGF